MHTCVYIVGMYGSHTFAWLWDECPRGYVWVWHRKNSDSWNMVGRSYDKNHSQTIFMNYWSENVVQPPKNWAVFIGNERCMKMRKWFGGNLLQQAQTTCFYSSIYPKQWINGWCTASIRRHAKNQYRYIYIYTYLSTPKIHKLRGFIWHVFMCSLHPSGGTHCGCIRSGAHMRKPNWLMISSGSVREPLPPGNLAQLLTVAIFNGKIHYE